MRKLAADVDPATAADIERTWRLMRRYHVSDEETRHGQLRLQVRMPIFPLSPAVHPYSNLSPPHT